MASYFGISQTDLSNALSAATITALFDDGTGVANATAVTATIDRGENELRSWLIGEWGKTLPADIATDPFLKYCAIDFILGFSIERHPEAARQAGLGTKESYFNRAKERAIRVMDGRQRPTAATEAPANVGGVVIDNSNRIITDSPANVAAGTSNAGDY